MFIFSRIKVFLRKILSLASKHKVVSSVILILVVGGSYYFYGQLNSTTSQVRYVLAATQKGTLVLSVSGTGQVSALNQIDIKPKVSGDVLSLGVQAGDTIKAGALIAHLDSTEAEKTVRDAGTNLQSAQLSLQKLQESATDLQLTQAQNAVIQAQQSKVDADSGLVKAYDDGFTSVASAFLDFSGVVNGVGNILNGETVNGTQGNAYAYYDMVKNYKTGAEQFRDTALNSFSTAQAAYTKNSADYKNVGRYSNHDQIEAIISETYDTTKLISEAIKNTKNYLDFVNDALSSGTLGVKPPAVLNTQESSLQSYTQTTNSHLSDLLNISDIIRNDKNAITNASSSIYEKTQALAELKAGANTLDVQSQQLAITQKQNALLDAQNALADYYVRAPFDGVVAKINVQKGDSTSPGTAIATMISSQQIATISLNEVDVASVKVGEQATLTFDAFPDLTIAGKVAEVDTIGTVSQGVVNYTVKIAFATQDSRIKPGMSVSASIVTDVKQDVLLVPNSALQTQGNNQFVKTINNVQSSELQVAENQGITSQNPPAQVMVTAGSSNDTMTEIISGLQEGDLVVARTIASSTQAQSQQSGGLRIPGLGGGGGFGGGVRTGGAGRGN